MIQENSEMNIVASNEIEKKTDNLKQAKIEEIFSEQQSNALVLRSRSLIERRQKIKHFLSVFEKYVPEIVEACKKDFEKPEAEVMVTEIFPVVHEAKHALKHLSNWMKPKKVTTTKISLGTKSTIVSEPKGVSLIISPWNYPFNLTFGPLVSAIAAGCTAIIKPSEMTPHAAKLISKIVAESFDEKEVAVFEGEADVSQTLLEFPFDHIFFTGSPAVGKIVMAAAARNLTSTTLELGGKSPAIVDVSANIKASAGKIVWGKFSNNGQTCIAPDYILVHEDVKDNLVKEIGNAIKSSYGKELSKLKNNSDYCRIVNDRHTARLKGLFDDAVENGWEVALGGNIDVANRFVSPTILTGRKENSELFKTRIMQEEIFGPLLPILTYKNIDEAIARINSQPKPLALYIFGNNDQFNERVIKRTSSGDVCVNQNLVHFLQSNLPFGGVNNSGIGSSHGEYGFKAFSHERSVLVDKFTANHLLYPPYKKRVTSLTKLLVKFAS